MPSSHLFKLDLCLVKNTSRRLTCKKEKYLGIQIAVLCPCQRSCSQDLFIHLLFHTKSQIISGTWSRTNRTFTVTKTSSENSFFIYIKHSIPFLTLAQFLLSLTYYGGVHSLTTHSVAISFHQFWICFLELPWMCPCCTTLSETFFLQFYGSFSPLV